MQERCIRQCGAFEPREVGRIQLRQHAGAERFQLLGIVLLHHAPLRVLVEIFRVLLPLLLAQRSGIGLAALTNPGIFLRTRLVALLLRCDTLTQRRLRPLGHRRPQIRAGIGHTLRFVDIGHAIGCARQRQQGRTARHVTSCPSP
ncbi:hypothetical protein [Xanthomonas oryzae]|uniref:hypothetical protein n=1 Tax=Xanthomonas oryzae TaxID=347 RepID=UPI001F4CA7EC|nr:hypothetical protein [Xanthomonas oryzae]UNE63804.1 hypothetical protein MML47_06300 [Xanthomonas oryzae]